MSISIYRGVYVPPSGPPRARVALVGERPGKVEARTGRPFVGPSGWELDRYLRMAGLKREELWITNLVKDFVGEENKEPTEEEILRDQEQLWGELRDCGCEIVIPLGMHATRYFLNKNVDMDTVWGTIHKIPLREFVDRRRRMIWCMPQFHPAAGLHNSNLIPHLSDGFRRLGLFLQGKLQPVKDEHPKPSYDELGNIIPLADLFPDSEPIHMAIDTEGTIAEPFCLTYSERAGTARLCRTIPPQTLRHTVIFHSATHDLPVLEAMGIQVLKYTDTMAKAFLLCTEPRGLKALMYRHCGMEQREYDDVVRAPRREKAISYLKEVIEHPYSWIQEEILMWDKDGKPKISKPWPIGKRAQRIMDDLVEKPESTDPRARWNKVRKDDESGRVEELEREAVGTMPDATLADIPFTEALDYACRDADGTGRVNPILNQKIKEEGLERVLGIDLAIYPMVVKMMQTGILVDPEPLKKLDEKCAIQQEEILGRLHRIAGGRVNPNSGDQVASLLFNRLRLRGKKKTASGYRFSTADKLLEAMRDEHPAVKLITDYRELSKIRTTYVTGILDNLKEDSRLHPDLSTTTQVTGRISCYKPNLLAIPIRTELGREIRDAFVAPEGKVLGEWDYSQLEMRILAHLSQDPYLCEAFRNGEDIHAKTGGLIFGKRPEDLDPYSERIPAKTTGFGVVYMIQPYGLSIQLNSLPTGRKWSEDDAAHLIKEWYKAAKGVQPWQQRVIAEARRTNRVRDMFGRMRRVDGVHCTDERVRAEVEREAVNFPIQSSASGIIKIAMASVWTWMRDVWTHVFPLLQIHDALLNEVPEKEVEMVDVVMCGEMGQAVQLRVPLVAKGHWGRTWKEAGK